MPTNFPGAVDTFTNPTEFDDLDTPGVLHDEQHINANDAIEAVESWAITHDADASAHGTYGAVGGANEWADDQTVLGVLKGYRDTFGTFDNAVVASLIGNRTSAPTTQVMGTTDPSATTERGSVTLFCDNTTRVPTLTSASTTFTATSVVFGLGVDVSGVEVGMIVDAGTKSGLVTAVDSATRTLTIGGGWRLSGGATTAPADGTTAIVNRVNKVWAGNFIGRKTDAATLDLSIAVMEVGVETDKDDAATGLDMRGVDGGGTSYSWGIDVVSIPAAGRPTIAYNARGNFQYHFAASGAFDALFIAHKQFDISGFTPRAAFFDFDSEAEVSFRAIKTVLSKSVVAAYYNAETYPRIKMTVDSLWFGAGATDVDCRLYRNDVDQIRSDSSLLSDIDLAARFGGAAQVVVGAQGPGGEAGAIFGSAQDVVFYREAANVAALGADDVLKTGRAVTGSRPAAATVGEGAQFYDTTLDIPIWSDGTNWRNAAGTVV